MGNKTISDLKELIKQASDIAKDVPENLQEAAFHRALDLLTGKDQSESPQTQNVSVKKSNKQPKKKVGEEINSDLNELIELIDSTKYPNVKKASKVLDRALIVLQIVLKDHGVDGLTPTEIAEILTEKFRLSTTKDAVRMVLGPATNLINRIKIANGSKYRIMGPGEEYLSNLFKNHESDSLKTNSKKVLKKKKSVKKDSIKKNSKKEVIKAKTKKPSSSRPGPLSMVNKLIDKGFFKEPKIISSIINYCKDKFAYTYKSSEFSPALSRSIRSNILLRKLNSDGQYEYSQIKK